MGFLSRERMEDDGKKSVIRRIAPIIFLEALFFISGCASGIKVSIDPTNQELEEKAPFLFEVKNASWTDGILHVFSEVTGLKEWKPSEVGLSLRVFQGPDETGRKVISVAQAAAQGPLEKSKTLKSGEPLLAHQSIAVTEFTDYEASVLWGNDAEEAMAAVKDAETPRAEIKDVLQKVQKVCESGSFADCVEIASIQATLVNSGLTKVNKVLLWAILESTPESGNIAIELQKIEEQITLSGLELPPGGSIPLKVRFREPLRKAGGNRISTQLRVLAVE